MSADSEIAPGTTGKAAHRGAAFFAAGGVLGALAASSCCIAPLALFALGVSGAWIGNLTALAPYQPLFIGATLLSLGSGYYVVYRRPAAACADGRTCAQPLPRRTVKLALWIASALILAAITFPYVAKTLLPV